MQTPASKKAPDSLSPQLARTAICIAQGLTNAEIATRMRVAFDTAKLNVAKLVQQTGIRRRTLLAIWAFHHADALQRAAKPVAVG